MCCCSYKLNEIDFKINREGGMARQCRFHKALPFYHRNRYPFKTYHILLKLQREKKKTENTSSFSLKNFLARGFIKDLVMIASAM